MVKKLKTDVPDYKRFPIIGNFWAEERSSTGWLEMQFQFAWLMQLHCMSEGNLQRQRVNPLGVPEELQLAIYASKKLVVVDLTFPISYECFRFHSQVIY